MAFHHGTSWITRSRILHLTFFFLSNDAFENCAILHPPMHGWEESQDSQCLEAPKPTRAQTRMAWSPAKPSGCLTAKMDWDAKPQWWKYTLCVESPFNPFSSHVTLPLESFYILHLLRCSLEQLVLAMINIYSPIDILWWHLVNVHFKSGNHPIERIQSTYQSLK